MPTKRCCCRTGCLITEDNFDRADSTDLGTDWVEESGDWEIATNRLTIDEIGLVRNKAVNFYAAESDPYDNQVVRVRITNYQDDTRYRIILQCNAGGSDYYYAEWHYVDSSNMYFRIGSNSGVIESLGPDLPITENSVVEFSATERNQFCMSDSSSRLTICLPPKAGRYTGLAAGTEVGATFDDYQFLAHKLDNTNCPSCDCDCEGWCIPDNLLATYQAQNHCPNLDGYEVTLHNSDPNKQGTGWYEGTGHICPGGLGGSEEIQLKLQCNGSSDITGITLTILSGSAVTTPGLSSTAYADPDVSTCGPISLRFGPFTYGNVSGCYNTTCCNGNPCSPEESTFYIWITPDGSDYDY